METCLTLVDILTLPTPGQLEAGRAVGTVLGKDQNHLEAGPIPATPGMHNFFFFLYFLMLFCIFFIYNLILCSWYNERHWIIITINEPVDCMARAVMILMRGKDITRAIGKGGP